MKYVLMLMFCILSGLVSKGQLPPVQELFASDSPTVYIAIVNKFILNERNSVKQVEKTKGLDVRITKDTVEIRPSYQGVFHVAFYTDEGIRNVYFLAKRLSPPIKRE